MRGIKPTSQGNLGNYMKQWEYCRWLINGNGWVSWHTFQHSEGGSRTVMSLKPAWVA
jgi:hypothetical protein